MIKWLLVGMVKFYKMAVSPLLPNSCIYSPSCSSYMIQAMDEHGILKGVLLGLRRILRCVPWKKGGLDPVPPNPKGDMKWLM